MAPSGAKPGKRNTSWCGLGNSRAASTRVQAPWVKFEHRSRLGALSGLSLAPQRRPSWILYFSSWSRSLLHMRLPLCIFRKLKTERLMVLRRSSQLDAACCEGMHGWGGGPALRRGCCSGLKQSSKETGFWSSHGHGVRSEDFFLQGQTLTVSIGSAFLPSVIAARPVYSGGTTQYRTYLPQTNQLSVRSDTNTEHKRASISLLGDPRFQ